MTDFVTLCGATMASWPGAGCNRVGNRPDGRCWQHSSHRTRKDELSMSEKQAVAAMRRLAKRWPKTLWLFAAGTGGAGNLCIVRKNADGSRAVLPCGSVDQQAIIATIDIECDGGDF